MKAQTEEMPNRVGRRPSQLREKGFETLRLLETCPLVPVDALVHLVGFSSASAAYKQVARLRRAGLAEMRRADLGYLLGERRLTLWKSTEEGRRVLQTVSVGKPAEDTSSGRNVAYRSGRLATKRTGPRDIDVTLLVASYCLLAAIAAEKAAEGRRVDVCSWEWPWVRGAWSEDRRVLRVTVPAGAVFKPKRLAWESAGLSGDARVVLLVPDLGTAPVARYREMLRRLVAFRKARMDDGFADFEPEVIVATPNPDGNGARSAAWLELLGRAARRQEEPALQVRVLGWKQVADVVGGARLPGLVAESAPWSFPGDGRRQALHLWRAPADGRQQLLHLVGRHPFLTVEQLAHLLETTSDRIKRLERELVEDGWLRRVAPGELPEHALGCRTDEIAALGLVEMTVAGRRRLAGWLGLGPAAATKYHGLIGKARREDGRRRRLLQTLAHTLGANAVFVAFAMAAAAARRQGGTDQLADWRSAAACERRRCKPDGYGCFVRNGVTYGFFVEYDRGTEAARKYAAKFGSYYRYRDSGQAAHDYQGFPTLLFVTIDQSAEDRIAEQAYRAWFIRCTEPLPMLITTCARIAGNPEGILGAIWRTPMSSPRGPERQYWLSGGPPRGLFGAGRRLVQAPRLVWPTARQASFRARRRHPMDLAGRS